MLHDREKILDDLHSILSTLGELAYIRAKLQMPCIDGFKHGICLVP